MKGDFWSAIKRGDPVENSAGEPVGEVTAVDARQVLVRDPVEQRELAIPRDACEPRPGSGLRLRPRPVHAAGAGPERFRRRPTLEDEWVAEQTWRDSALTVEGEDPLHARRANGEGVAVPPDEDVGEARDEPPSELLHGGGAVGAPRGDLGLGGRDRPSSRKLTPGFASGRRPREV
jgi:hypothetical protein